MMILFVSCKFYKYYLIVSNTVYNKKFGISNLFKFNFLLFCNLKDQKLPY